MKQCRRVPLNPHAYTFRGDLLWASELGSADKASLCAFRPSSPDGRTECSKALRKLTNMAEALVWSTGM